MNKRHVCRILLRTAPVVCLAEFVNDQIPDNFLYSLRFYFYFLQRKRQGWWVEILSPLFTSHLTSIAGQRGNHTVPSLGSAGIQPLSSVVIESLLASSPQCCLPLNPSYNE